MCVFVLLLCLFSSLILGVCVLCSFPFFSGSAFVCVCVGVVVYLFLCLFCCACLSLGVFVLLLLCVCVRFVLCCLFVL